MEAEMPGRKNAHCSYCGAAFADGQPWPRTCPNCASVSYVNPLPVAVALLPVEDGLLLVRRDIEPARGQLALPGGFIDVGETWQEACARELHEETAVVIDPRDVRLFQALSVTPHGFLLVFGLGPTWRDADLPPFEPTDETSERIVLRQPIELAFPFHTQVMREYFALRDRPRSAP
jgi:ADP-ribose pyrophosphatase YjhB (NUDIX family)